MAQLMCTLPICGSNAGVVGILFECAPKSAFLALHRDIIDGCVTYGDLTCLRFSGNDMGS